jgi:hypothetical protein
MDIIKKIFYATTTYGMGFEPSLLSDRYSIKIYLGGFANLENANERVEKEISNFQKQKDYTSHEIIERKYNTFPKYFEYTVKFNIK